MINFNIKCLLPSGNIVYVSELTNDIYIILLKYIMNNDILGFYQTLDKHIEVTYKDIYNLSILDKLFLYITLYAYSIKGNLELQSNQLETFGEQSNYSLFDVLDEIQEIKSTKHIIKLDTIKGECEVEIGIPSQLEEIEGEININMLSGVKKVSINSQNYILRTSEDLKVLELIFNSENYNKLTKEIIENYNFNIKLIKDKVTLPILSNKTFVFLAENLFFNNLDYIMTTMYSLLKYLHLSPTEYKTLTPADSEILLLKLVKDKQDEQKQSAKQNNSGNNEQFMENL